MGVGCPQGRITSSSSHRQPLVQGQSAHALKSILADIWVKLFLPVASREFLTAHHEPTGTSLCLIPQGFLSALMNQDSEE